ncbi:MAG TPA: hypothetical protein VF469_30590 [Kofleriaceae bacterium]
MTSPWNGFLRGAWRQLPVETVIVAASAIGAIGLVHGGPEVWCLRLLLTGLVATPLAFAAHRLDRFGRRLPVIAGGLAAAGVFAVIAATLRRGRLDDASFTWPYLLALVAAVLVPFVVPGPPFARFVRRFFEQTTTWAILCACGLAAVYVVQLALTQLFDLRIERLGADALIAVGCGFILIYLHRLGADDAAGGRMPELWRRLATMIGAPFVATMLVILVAYEILARARGELPRNVLSPLILAAGFAGFLSTLIMSSVLGEGGGTAVLAPADPHRWARRWSVRLTRAFPVILLALLPMACWALWSRIAQHGVTPFRAVRGMGLVCLASLSLVGTVRWARGRAALSWEVPAAVIAFALIAAFGPLGAVRLSLRSQAGRVAAALDEARAGRRVTEAAIEAPGPARFELSPERYSELEDALRELVKLGGEPAVRQVLTGATAACASSWEVSGCLQRLGVVPRGSEVATPRSSSKTTTLRARGRFPSAAGEVKWVEWIELARLPDEPELPLPGTGSDGSLSGQGFFLAADRVILHAGGTAIAQAPVAPLIAPPRGDGTLPLRTLALERPDGTVAAELAIEALDLWTSGDRPAQVVALSGIVIWR